MHAVSANTARQFRIGCDQQSERARPANRRQLARNLGAVSRAEMAINHRRSARQPLGYRDRIGRAFGVGKEKQRWNRWPARIAVEPARERG